MRLHKTIITFFHQKVHLSQIINNQPILGLFRPNLTKEENNPNFIFQIIIIQYKEDL